METQNELKTEDIENTVIGEDKPQITPKRVLIKNYKIETVKKEGKIVGNKLVLMCEHPDIKDKEVNISGVKFLVADKLKESGLWIHLDNDKKIGHNSSVGQLLRYLNKDKIKSIVGDQIDTVTDAGGYLLVKAY